MVAFPIYVVLILFYSGFFDLKYFGKNIGYTSIGFGIIISLAALTAFVSTANAGILSSSRTPLAMAKDDLLPSQFSLVSKRFQTPYFSIIFTGLFMLIL